MSYTRSCKTCGTRISIRKMPHGQYVAFEPHGQTPHDCYKPEKIIETSSAYLYEKDNTREILIEKEVVINVNDFYDIFQNAIEMKNILKIAYTREDGDFKEREICPIKIHERSNVIFFEAFCNLRNSNRIFRLDRITSMKVTENNFMEAYKPLGDIFINQEKEISTNIISNETNSDQEYKENIQENLDHGITISEENKKSPDPIAIVFLLVLFGLLFFFGIQ